MDKHSIPNRITELCQQKGWSYYKLAQEAGCKTFNGLYMLLYQGAEAFKLWTGKEMPIEPIKKKYFDR